MTDDEHKEKLFALLNGWIEREGLHLFSDLCRKDLKQLIGSNEAVRLLEADCTIGNYADAEDHREMRKAVYALLRKRGVQLDRGKRSQPEVEAMVKRTVPLLECFGVTRRTGDNSRMVLILRRVASELWPDGGVDPRHMLRRMARQEKERERFAYETIVRAIAAALRPD